MSNGASVNAYMSILGEDIKTESAKSSPEHELECLVAFEDVTEIQDALVNNSTDTENQVIRTNQLRLHPQHKNFHQAQMFGDVSVLLRRKCRRDGMELKDTGRHLEIQSQTLQTDLRQLLEDTNDGMNWNSDPIRFESPYYTLFFNRWKIESFTSGKAPSANRDRMRLVLDFIHMDQGHKTTLKQHSQYVPNGKITFEILWTIYTPNAIFIHNVTDIQECVRCISVPRLVTERTGEQFYIITVESLDFDGTHVGAKREHIRLEGFSGAKEITSLALTPLEGHPQQSGIEGQMKERYNQFRDLVHSGHSQKHAKCLAWVISDDEDEPELVKAFQVNGRVVIDYAAYLKSFPAHQCDLTEKFDHQEENKTILPSVPERFKMLCPARIPGFSLRHQRWGWLLVDEPQLSCIEWGRDSFQHLLMDEDKKSLIQTLIRGHLKDDGGGSQDVVAGKGQGLVILLHGPPGLGKTLLAESLSEHVQRPLYRATAGSLTINPSQLEQKLEELFELGKRWKALVLLDEAEVLMTSRTTGNLELNAVVAAFLRVLEYYEGILFLTTNKPSDFDEAIRNRIHLEVSFDPITPEARRIIWQNTLGRVSGKDDREGLWTAELFGALSEVEMNGREINNIVRLAACYASGDDLPMNPGHLMNIIRVKSSGSLGKLDEWTRRSYAI